MPDRPDPITDRLARFTPSASLDRDDLLYAAGRQSARSSRLWPVAVALLAVSQAATLVILWPAAPPPPIAVMPVEPARDLAPVVPPYPSDPDIWSVRSRLDVLQTTDDSSTGEFVSAGPPLTAGSNFRFD